MLYELMVSLRTHLSTNRPELTKVHLHRSDTTLTGIEKPFGTIQNISNPMMRETAGRTIYTENYYFQVGLFAEDFEQKIKLQSSVTNTLMEPIVLYGSDFLPTGETFVCEVNDFTPMDSEDIADSTRQHYGYFDVSVRIIRNRDEGTFSQ